MPLPDADVIENLKETGPLRGNDSVALLLWRLGSQQAGGEHTKVLQTLEEARGVLLRASGDGGELRHEQNQFVLGQGQTLSELGRNMRPEQVERFLEEAPKLAAQVQKPAVSSFGTLALRALVGLCNTLNRGGGTKILLRTAGLSWTDDQLHEQRVRVAWKDVSNKKVHTSKL